MFKFLLRRQTYRYLSDKTPKEKSKSEKTKPKLNIKLSNTPRPPKDPPDEGYAPKNVDHKEIEVSDFIRPEAYRQFSGPEEKLGPGAGKTKPYKTAHYFGYHRFSFVELQNQSLELRDEGRLNGGVQVSMEVEEEEELADDSIEAIKQQEKECDAMLEAQAKDEEKAKLDAWCKSVEKKQEEMSRLQMANNLGDEELKAWCEEIEQKKKQKAANNPKQGLPADAKKIQKVIHKRVGEILTECTDKLKKKDEKLALSECKDMVKKATDSVKLPEKPEIKEDAKKAEKGAKDDPKNVHKVDKKADDCATGKVKEDQKKATGKEEDKNKEKCATKEKESANKKDACEKPKENKDKCGNKDANKADTEGKK